MSTAPKFRKDGGASTLYTFCAVVVDSALLAPRYVSYSFGG